MIVWGIRGKIIRNVLCCIVYICARSDGIHTKLLQNTFLPQQQCTWKYSENRQRQWLSGTKNFQPCLPSVRAVQPVPHHIFHS